MSTNPWKYRKAWAAYNQATPAYVRRADAGAVLALLTIVLAVVSLVVHILFE